MKKQFQTEVEGTRREILAEVGENGPDLVTIPNVEIVSTGTYDLSSGTATFTHEDLVAAVGAQDDPAVRPPRLKIGHESDFGDGEPAFGKVTNMRLSEGGQTVLGDFQDVPSWLASIMATAYPSRSIEGALHAKTATGRTHRMLIEAVSLLGVVLPGVKTLEDLSTMYGSKMPEGTEIFAGTKVIAKTHVNASVSVEDVRREFYEQVATGDREWWWVREVQVDPSILIVEDDDGGSLYSVPYEASGDEVTFSDPTEVKIVYQNAASAVTEGGRMVAVFASRAESRENTKKENSMDPEEVRAALGLPEDATDEQVLEAVKTLKAKGDEEETSEVETDAETEETEDEEEGSETPETVEASSGKVTVDKVKWEETVKAAQEGQVARQEQLTEKRESILAKAVQDGKISPASKDDWRKKLKAAPSATQKELDSLAPGLIPVKETEVSASEEASTGGYDAGLFPELRASASSDPITKEQ